MQLTAIDKAHADLVYGLIVSFKPSKILEFGFGAGSSSLAILDAIKFNGNSPFYTIVDNWHDFGGNPVLSTKGGYAEIITSDEKDFVTLCLITKRQYDFIFSDADHRNADKWFDQTYDQLLSSPGILIYHDVTSPDFTNLKSIHDTAVQRNLNHFLFNRESRADERCSRGLLVIFKACD